MSFPSLPPPLSFELPPELIMLKEKFERGEISLNDAEVAIRNIIELVQNEEGIFSSTRDISAVNNNSNTLINTDETEDDQTLILVDEKDNGTRIPQNKNESAVEQRLASVEHMLQVVMSQIRDPDYFVRSNQMAISHAPLVRPALVAAGTSMISALSTSDNIVDATTAKDSDKEENDLLKKEVEDLKRQLAHAYVQNGSTLDDATSTSTGINVAKKKRKRKN